MGIVTTIIPPLPPPPPQKINTHTHIHSLLRRPQAEAALRPQAPGAFLLRPKGNNLDLVLTVRVAAASSSSGTATAPTTTGGGGSGTSSGGGSSGSGSSSGGNGGGSGGSKKGSTAVVRHFVIRVIPPSPSSAPSFRCGSVGPYDDLEDLLYEVRERDNRYIYIHG